MKQPRARLLVFNDPHPMRVDKDLAAEIGLNESILFLQIEYLIGISQHERDGRLWTYQSLQGLHDDFFPWWSVPTISRLVKALHERELIIVGNFNKSGFDRTQWFALNEEGIAKLRSVQLQPAPIFQDEKSNFHSDGMEGSKMKNRSYQNETTIPKSTSKTTTETTNGGERDLAKLGLYPSQVAAVAAAFDPIGGFTKDDYEACKQWLIDNPFEKNVPTLVNMLKKGQIPPPKPQAQRTTTTGGNGIRTYHAQIKAPDYDIHEARRRNAAYEAAHPESVVTWA